MQFVFLELLDVFPFHLVVDVSAGEVCIVSGATEGVRVLSILAVRCYSHIILPQSQSKHRIVVMGDGR